MEIKMINEKGLAEIRAFLKANHKQDFFTDEMISAWASDAEQAMGNGNPPLIEIPKWDTYSGRPETFTISPYGVATLHIADE